MSKTIAEHYDSLAPWRDSFRRRNSYYYRLLHAQYRFLVPPGKRVLEVGCSTGELLGALEPSAGVGIDISPLSIAIASQKYPDLTFKAADIKGLAGEEKFDYIVLSGLLGELDDIQGFLEDLKKHCLPETRVIIEYYSYFWQYLLKVAERLGWKMPQKIQNWLTHQDIVNFLHLAGYEAVRSERAILFPLNIPGFSYLVNRFIARLPFFNALTLSHFIIARPLPEGEKEYSVSIVIPCRNEKGNIEQAVLRTPQFGSRQEFIFVEGGSSDGTYEEVERVKRLYPKKDIKLYRQQGRGKADAVRLGFEKAGADILMILDADLTTPPEELPKFYRALASGKGEFINGCRLIYPIEKEAMRFLNLVANKLFGLFFSWLLGQRFKDTLCGTKALFRRHYQEIAKGRGYFGDFDPFGDFDLIFGAVKLNLKVVEMPVRYRRRSYGSTQISRFRHGALLLKMCAYAMRKMKFR